MGQRAITFPCQTLLESVCQISSHYVSASGSVLDLLHLLFNQRGEMEACMLWGSSSVSSYTLYLVAHLHRTVRHLCCVALPCCGRHLLLLLERYLNLLMAFSGKIRTCATITVNGELCRIILENSRLTIYIHQQYRHLGKSRRGTPHQCQLATS